LISDTYGSILKRKKKKKKGASLEPSVPFSFFLKFTAVCPDRLGCRAAAILLLLAAVQKHAGSEVLSIDF